MSRPDTPARPADRAPVAWRANAWVGGLLVGSVVAVSLLALWWTPYDPMALNLRAKLQPPSGAHWLGTDEFGRDVASRLMAGARSSTIVAVATVMLATLLGVVVGVLSGFLRGWTDRVLMALNDALLAFPGILLALALMVVVGANRWGIVLALGLAYAPTMARVVRGVVLSLRETEYVEASRMIGNSDIVTMLRHVLPNCVALPGPGRPAPGPDLGQHAGQQPTTHADGRLAGPDPGALHRADAAGHQPAGRRRA
jgi:peptide/nickel transport system permease protein